MLACEVLWPDWIVRCIYLRIAEATAQSEPQFKMLMAFIEKDLLPKNIVAGQLNGEFLALQTHVLWYRDLPQSQRLTSL